MTLKIGAHAHSPNPLDDALALGTPVAQFNLSDPQSWKKPNFTEDVSRAAAEGIDLYVHAPFVINVASMNNRIRIRRGKSCSSVAGAARVGAKGVVVHGGHVTKDDDPAKGFENWRKAVDGLEVLPDPIFIENTTCGGSFAMARYLEALRQLAGRDRGQREHHPKVRVLPRHLPCVRCGPRMESLVDDVLAITGRIDLVHLNDSQGAMRQRRRPAREPRRGNIPDEQMIDVIKAADAPVITGPRTASTGIARISIGWLRASESATCGTRKSSLG